MNILAQLPLFDPSSLDDLHNYYLENGLVVIKILDDSLCKELVLEQWRNILLKQPWKEEYRIRVRGKNGCILDIDSPEDRTEFLRIVMEPLSKETREHFEQGWCLHRGFGACCDPCVFHLPLVWSIRQNPNLYDIASRLMGRTELWVDINRSIQKLPGQGDDEFLHWDFNPFHPDAQCEASPGVCGKACYTRSRFVAVLGTHTPDCHRRFADAYRQHYPGVKPADRKFGLRPDRPDPLGLARQRRVFEVPAGCVVLWSPLLLHGQASAPRARP